MTPAPDGPPDQGFATRLAAVLARIEGAVPDPGAVTIVAVTKGFGPGAVRTALAAGVVDLGENYADELVAKAAALGGPGGTAAALGGPGGTAAPVWHYLGAIQRNKVARLAPLVSCWQSVARLDEGRTIARRRPGATVLVQVDVAGLPGRGGVPPPEVAGLVAGLRDEELDVAGLMAVGPPGAPEAARPGFRVVARLADELGLRVRSMGMTDDLEVALAEGSTMVRLGRALFGDRPSRRPGG